MGPLEFNAGLGRTQDISTIKQAEDAKPIIDQQNILHTIEKNIDEKSEQVYKKDDLDMGDQFDASKEGKGLYQKDQRKKKQAEEKKDGKVVLKNRATFDVKI